jgi:biopolymer transport protein ExbD
MTPMIDIVFLLLIFFLLSPTADAGRGYLTTNLPRTGPNARPGIVDDRRAVLIELAAPGPNSGDVTIVLNRGRVFGRNFEGLLAALQDLRATGLAADQPVRIAPEGACRHKWVVRAFDVAVAARFTDIRFAVPYGPRGPADGAGTERTSRTDG